MPRQRHRDQEAQSMTTTSMTTTKVMWLASLVTAINVLVASGFSIAGLISPQSVLPAGYVPTEASSLFAMYAAARTVPLALITLVAIYNRATAALLILGTLAGVIQLLDAGIGLFQHDAGKCAGPFAIAAIQFSVLLLLNKSTRGPRG
jgi:nitrate reductase gamma subunit